jgi:hypothetical protein
MPWTCQSVFRIPLLLSNLRVFPDPLAADETAFFVQVSSANTKNGLHGQKRLSQHAIWVCMLTCICMHLQCVAVPTKFGLKATNLCPSFPFWHHGAKHLSHMSCKSRFLHGRFTTHCPKLWWHDAETQQASSSCFTHLLWAIQLLFQFNDLADETTKAHQDTYCWALSSILAKNCSIEHSPRTPGQHVPASAFIISIFFRSSLCWARLSCRSTIRRKKHQQLKIHPECSKWRGNLHTRTCCASGVSLVPVPQYKSITHRTHKCNWICHPRKSPGFPWTSPHGQSWMTLDPCKILDCSSPMNKISENGDLYVAQTRNSSCGKPHLTEQFWMRFRYLWKRPFPNHWWSFFIGSIMIN